MFYRSARNAEFEVPKQYMDEGLDFVERRFVADPAQREEGLFLYRPLVAARDAKPSLANTGSAMLALLLGGRHEGKMVQEGIQWYNSRPYPSSPKSNYFYLGSYYNSQAVAQVGGDTWNRIYPQIAAALLKTQLSAGAWPPGRGNEYTFESTYSTSLAVLALTPAYQLLPIYQR